ncbi:MAG TPA: hypothetical protein VF609_05280 [Flavisolibacter sp.]
MRANFFYFLLACVLLFSCKKETEVLETVAPSTYFPTSTGKYISYRLDSTVVINFGGNIVVKSYQEKHQVDALTTDNLGRPAYRVFRFTRDTLGTTAWQPSGTYFITPTENAVEVIENNLRFLKLAGPVTEGKTWTGNKFLPLDPYGPLYEFFNDDGMVDWEYFYESTGNATINGKQYQNVLTVEQINDVSNIPVTVDAVGYKNRAVEKYAKGIGLVYQELLMLEYQPTSSPRSGFKGFGVKRSIIDHN